MSANNSDFGMGAMHARLGQLGTQSNDPKFAGPGSQTTEYEGGTSDNSVNENKFAGNANSHLASNGNV